MNTEQIHRALLTIADRHGWNRKQVLEPTRPETLITRLYPLQLETMRLEYSGDRLEAKVSVSLANRLALADFADLLAGQFVELLQAQLTAADELHVFTGDPRVVALERAGATITGKGNAGASSTVCAHFPGGVTVLWLHDELEPRLNGLLADVVKAAEALKAVRP